MVQGVTSDPNASSQPGRRRPGIAMSPSTPAVPTTRRKTSNSFSHNFKFPASPPAKGISPERPRLDQPAAVPPLRRPSPRSPNSSRGPHNSSSVEPFSPIARVLSGTSMEETPRSSGEFYSMSNNSDETLVSEYAGNPSNRMLPRPVHHKQISQPAPPPKQSRPESLMMGYAQVMGSFILDGSLVNQAPFEEVKRKGVVGGQGGGGVVGVERTKRESGLFGSTLR